MPASTLGQGTFGTWHILSSISMVDSVTCLRYAECSRAPDYSINGYGYQMQTISCTRRYVGRAYFLPTHIPTPPFGPGEKKLPALGP